MKKMLFIILIFIFANANTFDLLYAIHNNNFAKVKKLVSKENINSKYQNITPLIIASQEGKLNIVKYLISKGANVNLTDSFNRPPLFFAVDKGHLDVVKYLISHGALLNYNYKFKGNIPLLNIAICYFHPKIADYLISKGIKDINLSFRSSYCTYSNDYPIHTAIRSRDKKLIIFLLSKGANINMKNYVGYTPIDIAVYPVQDINEIKYLLSKGAKYDEDILFRAVVSGNLNIVKYFVSRGINVNIKDKNGMTPLTEASYNGINEKIIEYLLNNGADINSTDNDGENALYIAIENGYFDIAKYLISKGINIHIKDKNNNNLLHVLMQSSDISSITNWYGRRYWRYNNRQLKYLNNQLEKYINKYKYFINYFVSKGVNINEKNEDGDTPTDLAVMYMGDLNLIKYLVSKGAKINKKDIEILANNNFCDMGEYDSPIFCFNNTRNNILKFLKETFNKQNNNSIKTNLSKENKSTWRIKLFSKNYISRIDSVIKLKDGFLVSGGINTNGFIVKVNKNGKMMWKKIINTNGEGVFGDKYKILKIHNQLYILVLPSAGNQVNLFALLDKNGNIIKKENLDFTPTSYYADKNNIFIGGMKFSQKYNKLINTLEKYNIFLSNGKIWEKFYPEKDDTWVESILVLKNNIYLVDYVGNLIKLNKNGKLIEKKHIFLEDDKFAIKIDKDNLLLIYKNRNKIEKISFNGKNKVLINLEMPTFKLCFNQVCLDNSRIILAGYTEIFSYPKNYKKVFICSLDNNLNIKYIKFLFKGKPTSLFVKNNSIILGIEKSEQAILMRIR